MLSSGFEWTRYLQWDTGPLNCLKLDGQEVARLTQRVDNQQWLAVLDQHLDCEQGRSKTRPCRSYETGKAGIEAWALRHEVRLREEVAAKSSGRRW